MRAVVTVSLVAREKWCARKWARVLANRQRGVCVCARALEGPNRAIIATRRTLAAVTQQFAGAARTFGARRCSHASGRWANGAQCLRVQRAPRSASHVACCMSHVVVCCCCCARARSLFSGRPGPKPAGRPAVLYRSPAFTWNSTGAQNRPPASYVNRVCSVCSPLLPLLGPSGGGRGATGQGLQRAGTSCARCKQRLL